MQTVEITAKSVQDATQQAADKLGVTPEQVRVTILEEVKGLFGKTTVRVRGELAEPVAPVEAEASSPPKPSRSRRSPKPAVEATPVETHATEAPAESEDKAENGRKPRGKRAAAVPEAEAVAEGPGPDLATPAEEVAASQADADILLSIIRELLQSAQLAVTAEIGEISGRYVNIVLDGRDVSFIVGKHGDVLNAMQYLVNIIAGRKIERGVRATLDGNDYRRRREEALTTLAQRIAEQVRVRGEEAVLDALPAFERRIVHKALSEMPGVTTYSEGEEPNRRVVIAPE